MKIQIINNNYQQNKPSFKAKLQLKENTGLVANDGVETLKEIVSRIGSKTDIIDIALPISNRFSKGKANVNIAGYVNGALEQFVHSIEKTDVLGSLIEGLKSNYVIKEKTPINKDAWKEVIDLKDEETFEAYDLLRVKINCDWYLYEEHTFKSVKDMLERINEPIKKDRRRLIHYAVRNPDFLKLCLKHPNIDVNVQDSQGKTALHYASSTHYVESLKLLLEREDIDTTLENVWGNTAEQVKSGDAYTFWDEYAKNGYKKFW